MKKETAFAVVAAAAAAAVVSGRGPAHCWVMGARFWVLGSARSKMAGGGGPQVGRRLQHSL